MSNWTKRNKSNILRKMKKMWGPRCPDIDEHCPVCQAWMRYDKTGRVTKTTQVQWLYYESHISHVNHL